MNIAVLYITSGIAFSVLVLLYFLFNRLSNVQQKLADYERGITAIIEENRDMLADVSTVSGGSVYQLLEDLSKGLYNFSEELTHEKNIISEILYAIHDGVFIVDRSGKLILINKTADDYFSITSKSVIGLSFISVVRDHEIDAIVRKCLESGDNQVKIVHMERTKQSFHITVSAIQDGVLVIMQDITKIRHLENVRKEFVSNISHELRTPIASLKAIVETLRDGAINDKAIAHKFLGKTETEIDKLAELVNELGELSTIESHGIELNMELSDPGEICKKVTERMTAQAEKKQVLLLLHLPSFIPQVWCDKNRLEQVLLNLVHNAIKFTPTKGVIEISLMFDEYNVIVSVIDNGIGIPADDLPHVFERFYKVDKARASGGTGLGLAIAKHLVFAHSGLIWVESVEGKGSKFSFSIPVISRSKQIEKADIEVSA